MFRPDSATKHISVPFYLFVMYNAAERVGKGRIKEKITTLRAVYELVCSARGVHGPLKNVMLGVQSLHTLDLLEAFCPSKGSAPTKQLVPIIQHSDPCTEGVWDIQTQRIVFCYVRNYHQNSGKAQTNILSVEILLLFLIHYVSERI